MSYQELLEKTPMCICPVFRTARANEPLIIYEGAIRYEQGGIQGEGSGEIRQDWLPRPAIRFELNFCDGDDARYKLDLANLSLIIPVLSTKLTASPTHLGENLLGYVESNTLGLVGDVNTAKFSLPNFREYHGTVIRNENGSAWAGRAIMEAEGLKIILDRLDHTREQTAELKASGGYATTHAGEAVCVDGSPLSFERARAVREDLFWFLSFCRGRWTGPVMMTGHAANGDTLWTEISSAKISSWRHSWSWLHEGSRDGLSLCFPGFIRCRRSPVWQEPLTLAIHWFVEANMCAGGIEGSIVLTQAALEMVAWHLLIEDKKICSISGFRNLPAEDKIRLLLNYCGIPFSIPQSLPDLIAEGLAFNWDGPLAITQIRNALVHGQPKPLETELNRDHSARHDTWCLGLWYLELTLLKLFGYDGKYFNRVKRESYSLACVDTVPWATATS